MGRRTLSDSVLLSSLDPFDLMNLSYKGKSHSVSFHGSYELNLKSSTRSPDSGRKYVKGDPLRMIDWKAYARSNQLIVRETARESSVHVGLFCCLEESMFWPDHGFLENHEGTVKSKLDLSLRIILHLAFLHIEKGDCPYILFYFKNKIFKLRVESTMSLYGMYSTYLETGEVKVLYDQGEEVSLLDLQKNHINYLVSDLISDNHSENIMKELESLCVFHVLSSWEIDPSWAKKKSVYYNSKPYMKILKGSTLQGGDFLKHEVSLWADKMKERVKLLKHEYILLNDKLPINQYFYFLESLFKKR